MNPLLSRRRLSSDSARVRPLSRRFGYVSAPVSMLNSQRTMQRPVMHRMTNSHAAPRTFAARRSSLCTG